MSSYKGRIGRASDYAFEVKRRVKEQSMKIGGMDMLGHIYFDGRGETRMI